jgi:hypothetical protein
MKALTEYMEEPDQEVRLLDTSVATLYWDKGGWQLTMLISAAGRW